MRAPKRWARILAEWLDFAPDEEFPLTVHVSKGEYSGSFFADGDVFGIVIRCPHPRSPAKNDLRMVKYIFSHELRHYLDYVWARKAGLSPEEIDAFRGVLLSEAAADAYAYLKSGVAGPHLRNRVTLGKR